MARTVVAPDGRTWKVGRRAIAGRPRWRGPKGKWLLDNADPSLGMSDGLSALLLTIAVIACLALLVFFVIPLLLLVAEAVVVGLAVAGFALSRIVLRRPWTVEAAIPGTSERRTWSVVGWRASARLVDRLAENLATSGRLMPTTWVPEP